MFRSSLFCLLIVSLLTLTSSAADGPNLDIAGIKIGMEPKAAIAALKAANPKGNLMTNSAQLQGFTKPVEPTIVSDQTASAENDGEKIELLLTLPPNQATVWGISRTHHYIDQNRPSLENTLAALRAKYGPESLPASPDPRDRTKSMIWIFDAQGKLLSKDEAMTLIRTCGAKLQSHFGNGDIASFNDIQSGNGMDENCKSIAIISASVQAGSITPGSSELAVYNLIVQMNDARIYSKAIEATRGVATGAAKARENKAADEVNKRGAPKL